MEHVNAPQNVNVSRVFKSFFTAPNCTFNFSAKREMHTSGFFYHSVIVFHNLREALFQTFEIEIYAKTQKLYIFVLVPALLYRACSRSGFCTFFASETITDGCFISRNAHLRHDDLRQAVAFITSHGAANPRLFSDIRRVVGANAIQVGQMFSNFSVERPLRRIANRMRRHDLIC